MNRRADVSQGCSISSVLVPGTLNLNCPRSSWQWKLTLFSGHLFMTENWDPDANLLYLSLNSNFKPWKSMQTLQHLTPRNPWKSTAESKLSALPDLANSKMKTRRDSYSWSVWTVTILYHAQFTSGPNQGVLLAWKPGHRLIERLHYSPYPASQGCAEFSFLGLDHCSKWIPAHITLTQVRSLWNACKKSLYCLIL